MQKSFKQRFLEEAGEHPYAWVVALGLPKDLVSAVARGNDDYRPIQRTLKKLADATGKSVTWWLTGDDGADTKKEQTSATVVGTVAAGSARVDVHKLELAVKALTDWEVARGKPVSDERRPAVIAVLYDYIVSHPGKEQEGLATVLRAIG
ncbi:hypothetical protein ACO0LO_01965 [Undibacterium sp. TJN25]|uniref:hypothetical protein n=1 Tax=Undibacterium sp. TJN25 TaxID=3413056 RepID=UPI003BEF79A3